MSIETPPMRTHQRSWARRKILFLPVPLVLASIGMMGLVGAFAGEGDQTSDAVRESYFEQNVRPLLAENCYSCHGEKKQKGGLRLDSIEAILKGGESGPAVVPGKPDESLLVSAINYAGPETPPRGKLTGKQVAALTRWISAGAPWPRGDRGAHASINSTTAGRITSTAAIQSLWSLQPIHAYQPPELSSARDARWSFWPRNPIDRFILKGLRDHDLTPAP